MKAAIVPSENSNWEVKEIDMPEPGESQVLIKIRASGMCYTDVHQTHGGSPGGFPRTLGHEPAGKSLLWGPVSRCARRAIASASPGYNTLADAANGVRAANQYFVKKASARECR
jgi:hypothetical protein